LALFVAQKFCRQHQAMQSEQRVLIARYCFRKDSQPRMVALIPKKGQQQVFDLKWQ
jgi:hypothetical protein